MIILITLLVSLFVTALVMGAWLSLSLLFGISAPTDDQFYGVLIGIAVASQVSWLAIFAWEDLR